MNNLPINPNVVPLLQGLRPYMKSGPKLVTDGVLHLVQMLSSSHGQEAVKAISNALTAPGKDHKIITVNTVAGPVTFSLNMAFVLFLILILLILSGNLLALNPGTFGGGYDCQPPCPDQSTSV